MTQIRLINRGSLPECRGFTLIELMFVVTIIGVLTSIAMPTYRDYIIRVRVAEAASAFYPVKSAYTMFYSINGVLPTSLEDLPGISSDRFDSGGDYVNWLRVRNNGNVRLRTRDIIKLRDAANKLMEFRPDVAGNSPIVNWEIFSREDNANWMPQKYLPTI